MTMQRKIAFHSRGPSRASRRILASALTLSVALSGCNDPKAATKENFKKGLAAFFEKNCALLTPVRTSMDLFGRSTTFPMNLQSAPVVDPDTPRFVALTAAGLLHQGPQQTTLNAFRQVEASKAYTLTDKGQSLWKAANSMGPGSPAGFCAGHLQVDEVDSFTDPVVQGGTKVSTVNFRLHTTYDAWTQASDIQAAFRDEMNHAAPAPASMPMVLMNDGWTVSTAPAETAPGLNPLPR